MNTRSSSAKRIAIIGGGPASLFVYKRFVESEQSEIIVEIFESKSSLGEGMPYSRSGAGSEHITNVSGNEISKLITPVVEWIGQLPEEKIRAFHLEGHDYSEFKVFPRLLFGEYLHAQYEEYIRRGRVKFETCVRLRSTVTDIVDRPDLHKILVQSGDDVYEFDIVIICTGHEWPKTLEGKVPGFFDSPYPPAKLEISVNHAVAIRGSSLTAIDAIRTLARHNGCFIQQGPHNLKYQVNDSSENFRIVMHSRHGLLPGIRFHLDDPRLSASSLLSKDELDRHMENNNGFLSLDFLFEKDFKESFRKKDPVFFELIRNMDMEQFVQTMMDSRDKVDAFEFFRNEYEQAKVSIRTKESVYWKEMLAILSFAMNYPAKHFSAEDMLRLQRVLMPLISMVIAFVPQSSAEELIALHEAGRLELIEAGEDSKTEITAANEILLVYTDRGGKEVRNKFMTYVDCIGQKHLRLDQFPFQSLVKAGTVAGATLAFRSADAGVKELKRNSEQIQKNKNGDFELKVPGLFITDCFNAVGSDSEIHSNLFIMAVPFIGGFNPDYSGLDFCEEASKRIVDQIFSEKF